MSQSVIQRVDLDALASTQGSGDGPSPSGGQQPGQASTRRALGPAPQVVRWFILPLSILLCIAQSVLTIAASNTASFVVTSTLLAVVVMGIIFGLALIANPALRCLYIGRWVDDDKITRLQAIQGLAGKLTLGFGLAIAATGGPFFIVWTYGFALLAAAVTLAIDLAFVARMDRAIDGSTGRLSWLGRGAIQWVITLAITFALTFLAAKATGSLTLALILPAVVALTYGLLWCLCTHAFTRAELMTLMAALVVASGVSTFGMTEQLVPLVTTPYNPEWNTPQARWTQDLHPNLRQSLFITDAKAITEYREGLQKTRDGQNIVQPSELQTGWRTWVSPSSWSNWTDYYWTVANNIPWSLWLPPLGYWMIFILASYAMFYSLTYTVVGYWADREKLIFPLAQLSEALLPDADRTRWLPAIMRSTGFWAAMILTGGVLSYNASVSLGLLGDMAPISLGMKQGVFTTTVSQTILEGLGGSPGGMRVAFIFTAVGIAFLLPLEISFSIWFYYLASCALMLVLVGAGYGRDTRDFPSDWLYTQNEVTAQGMGAILVFSVIMLFRALKDNTTQIFSRKRPTGQRLISALPVVGLTASITVLTMWIWWMWQWNTSYLFWALVFVVFIVLLTLGLMRITAEGGIYWFHAHASFFHFWKMLALGKFLPGTMLGPLLPVYSVLFLDIKTFMAPNIINGAKMQKDVGGNRALYHLNMIVTVLVSVVVSVGFAVVMAYARGAQRMHSWFYSSGPKSAMTTAQEAASSVPEFNSWTASWALGGGLWVIFTVLIRRTIFWFPHPIGYIMLINPMIQPLWFSFFVGWLCKKLVVKYGGKSTFDKTRDIFIGLIVGEILAICLWGLSLYIRGETSGFPTHNNTF